MHEEQSNEEQKNAELISESFGRLLETGIAHETTEGGSEISIEQALKRFFELNPYDLSITLDALKTIIALASSPTAGFTAMLIGCAIERGFSPERGVPVVVPGLVRALNFANRHLAVCKEIANVKGCELDDTSESEIVEEFGKEAEIKSPDTFSFFSNLSNYCLPAIAGLSRSKELRKSIDGREDIISRATPLSAVAGGAGFLVDMLRVLDDEPLLVLHPASGLGFRFKMSGIADNFQLHILLAGALIGDWPEGKVPGVKPHPKVLAASMDQPVDAAHNHAEGAFDLYNWPVLNRGGFLPQKEYHLHVGFRQFEIVNTIWGEGVPADILVFDGKRIIILNEPSVNRGWNAGRRFDGMMPELLLEEVLPRIQVRRILEFLGAEGFKRDMDNSMFSKFREI